MIKNSKGFFFSILRKIVPRVIKEYLYFIHDFILYLFQKKEIKKEIVNLSQEKTTANNKLKIFIWEPGGCPFLINVLGIIGLALELRGHSLKLLLCKGSKIACTRRSFFSRDNFLNWSKSCQRCSILCSKHAKLLNLDYDFIDNYITKDRLSELYELSQRVKFEDIYNFSFKGYYVGKNVYSSLIRYLRGFPITKEHKNILKIYLYSSFVNIEIAENLISKEKPDRIITSQGVYTDYGTPLRVFLKNNIPVCVGFTGHKQNCLSFSFPEHHQKISPQMISNKTWEKYKNKPLSEFENEELEKFLYHRYYSDNSLDVVSESKAMSRCQKLNFIDFKKTFKNNNPIWCIFTHLSSDAVYDMYPMVYKDFYEWLVDTIREIIKIKNINWIIKIHPHDFMPDQSCQQNYGLYDAIRNYFRELPAHIKILKNNFYVNNLELYKNITGGITVFGTAGLELLSLGKPVLLAGDSHYAQKGFTYDGLTHKQYIYYLRNVRKLKPLSNAQIKKARRYAHLYFIKKEIPFDYFQDGNFDYFERKKIKNIKPGKDKYLDFICDCIVNKKDFILP